MRTGISITVSTADRRRLEAVVADRNSPQKHVWRARIILLTGAGLGTMAIMAETGKSKPCVWRWQERYMQEGVAGLVRDKTRPSRIAPLPQATVDEILALTKKPPPNEATHWVGAIMAKAVGVSVSTVQRSADRNSPHLLGAGSNDPGTSASIWTLGWGTSWPRRPARSASRSARCSGSGARTVWRNSQPPHGLQPHRWRLFKLSNDPGFAEKVRDIVGLYMDPPAHAVVLSVDEKSQIQALDRTQPGLPMKKGRCGTMTHDYKRNGTTTLFAALSVLDGRVIGRNMQRHRHQEFIRFLNVIERDIPAGKMIHAILDNYATHKHPKVKEWLRRHPRWTFHFTPTSSSWINAVEGYFAKLTKRRLKRGVFHSIADLQKAINRFINETNENPKPFVWTKEPDKIIAAVRRGHQVLDSIH